MKNLAYFFNKLTYGGIFWILLCCGIFPSLAVFLKHGFIESVAMIVVWEFFIALLFLAGASDSRARFIEQSWYLLFVATGILSILVIYPDIELLRLFMILSFLIILGSFTLVTMMVIEKQQPSYFSMENFFYGGFNTILLKNLDKNTVSFFIPTSNN